MTADPGPVRVAYLVSQYPALSHAFIEREVLELRAAGAQVTTFTVRRCPPEQLKSAEMRREDARTTALLGQAPTAYVREVARYARTGGPGALLGGVRAAVRAGRGGPRDRAWQAFYLVEALRLVAIMRAIGLRHVHVHFANNGADVARLACVLGNGLRTPDDSPAWTWSFSMHGPTELEDPDAHGLRDKTRDAAFVACISAYARDRLAGYLDPQDRHRLPIVHMGVDSEHFPPAAAERRARAPGALRVLFVGRLVTEKGPDVLVEALARLGLPFVGKIVGAGPLAEQLHDLITERGLAGQIHLLGGRGQDELPELYRWADVFCLPSFREGVPVVLMEAMASELPVVTTAVAGIPELVTDGVSGLFVPPGDPDALAAAVRELALDPDRRETFGRAGRHAVLRSFTAEPNARRLLAAFRTSAGQSVPG